MKLKITKPFKGRCDVRLDDRRGLTGIVLKVNSVKMGEVPAVVAPLVQRWEAVRKTLLDARKAASA